MNARRKRAEKQAQKLLEFTYELDGSIVLFLGLNKGRYPTQAIGNKRLIPKEFRNFDYQFAGHTIHISVDKKFRNNELQIC